MVIKYPNLKAILIIQNLILALGLLKRIEKGEFQDMGFHNYLDQHELLHYFGTNDRASVPSYHMMALEDKYLAIAKQNNANIWENPTKYQLNNLTSPNNTPVNVTLTSIPPLATTTQRTPINEKPCPSAFNFSLALTSNATNSSSPVTSTFVFAVKRNEQFLATDFLSFEIRGQYIYPLAYDLDDILGNSEITSTGSVASADCFYTGEGTEIKDKKLNSSGNDDISQKVMYSTSVLATPTRKNGTTKSAINGAPIDSPRKAIVAFDLLDRLNGIVRVGDDEFYVIKPIQSHILKRVRRRRKRDLNQDSTAEINSPLHLDKVHIMYKWSNYDFQQYIIRDLKMDPKLPHDTKFRSKRKRNRNRRKVEDTEQEWNRIIKWNTDKETTTQNSPDIDSIQRSMVTGDEVLRKKPIFDWDKNTIMNIKNIGESSESDKIFRTTTTDFQTANSQSSDIIINTIYDNIRENEGDEYFEQAFYPKTCSVNKYYNDTIDEKDMAFIKNVNTDVMDVELDIFDIVSRMPIIKSPQNEATIKNISDVVREFAKKKIPKIAVSVDAQIPKNQSIKSNLTNKPINKSLQKNRKTTPKSIEGDDKDKKTASARIFVRPVLELAGFLDQALIKLKIERNRMNIAEIRNQYLSLFHFVHLLYMHPTIGTPININLVRLFVMTQNPAQMPAGNSYIRSLIMQFSHYQYALNGQRIWDNSVLLTGNDLYDINGAFTEKRVIGYGFYGQFVCDPILSVSLNEGMDGFGSAITITHEMGHNFGMDHDTVASGCDSRKYIMAENLGIGQVTWSACSARHLRNYVNSPAFRCLFQSNNIPQQIPGTGNSRVQIQNLDETNIFTNRVYPGILYDVNEQCRSFNGPTSGHDARQNLETICQYVLCTNTISRFYRFPALEGTVCSPQKWCRGGMCIPKNQTTNSKLVKSRNDRGWSPWYLSIPCTSLCFEGSAGIEEFRRTCLSEKNNQDEDCKGDFIYYSLCTTFCPKRLTSLNDFITARCTNGSLYQAMFVLTGKGYQKSFNKKDVGESCRLYCGYKLLGDRSTNYPPKYIIRSILPTGTRCNTNPDMYCVKGVCQKVNLSDPFNRKKA